MAGGVPASDHWGVRGPTAPFCLPTACLPVFRGFLSRKDGRQPLGLGLVQPCVEVAEAVAFAEGWTPSRAPVMLHARCCGARSAAAFPSPGNDGSATSSKIPRTSRRRSSARIARPAPNGNSTPGHTQIPTSDSSTDRSRELRTRKGSAANCWRAALSDLLGNRLIPWPSSRGVAQPG
jgi:hypothetical protein